MRRGSVFDALAPSTEPGTQQESVTKHLLSERKAFSPEA